LPHTAITGRISSIPIAQGHRDIGDPVVGFIISADTTTTSPHIARGGKPRPTAAARRPLLHAIERRYHGTWRVRRLGLECSRAPGRQVALHQTTISYGPIRDLGELFIELAGSEAINECFKYPARFPMRS
jgi:hypothetical protein